MKKFILVFMFSMATMVSTVHGRTFYEESDYNSNKWKVESTKETLVLFQSFEDTKLVIESSGTNLSVHYVFSKSPAGYTAGSIRTRVTMAAVIEGKASIITIPWGAMRSKGTPGKWKGGNYFLTLISTEYNTLDEVQVIIKRLLNSSNVFIYFDEYSPYPQSKFSLKNYKEEKSVLEQILKLKDIETHILRKMIQNLSNRAGTIKYENEYELEYYK